jgi:putative PIN family toxin of toxin-antitoxin system
LESDPNFPPLLERTVVVLDTNIVLDLFVFNDPAAQPLRDALTGAKAHWLATMAMREELQRVLTYPQIVRSLAHHKTTAAQVLDHFDAHVAIAGVAAKARITCKDPDDQKFIDLAVAHAALLLSKDHAVLCMAKRLLAQGVIALPAMKLVAN